MPCSKGCSIILLLMVYHHWLIHSWMHAHNVVGCYSIPGNQTTILWNNNNNWCWCVRIICCAIPSCKLLHVKILQNNICTCMYVHVVPFPINQTRQRVLFMWTKISNEDHGTAMLWENFLCTSCKILHVKVVYNIGISLVHVHVHVFPFLSTKQYETTTRTNCCCGRICCAILVNFCRRNKIVLIVRGQLQHHHPAR